VSAPALHVVPVGEMAPDVETFTFSEANRPTVDAILNRYPADRKQSAVLPLLHLAQEQHGGWLPRAALDHVAEVMGIPRMRVYEVATFYDMYNTVPVGRIQVRVCTTTPCWLCGSDDVVRACRDTLGIDIGQSTPDGRFFLREFECLGACSNAPVLWVDEDFYEDLTYERTKTVLEALKRGELPKAGPQSDRRVSEPAGGKTTLLGEGG
jgi:NADH-quinone oxidoreductase E subunit